MCRKSASYFGLASEVVGKNLAMGALGGGVLGGLFAAVAMGLFAGADGNTEMTVVMSLTSAVLVSVPAAGLGGLAGALAAAWPVKRIAFLGAGLAGALSGFVALSLIATARGNWVVASLLFAACTAGGFAVTAIVARWRRPKGS